MTSAAPSRRIAAGKRRPRLRQGRATEATANPRRRGHGKDECPALIPRRISSEKTLSAGPEVLGWNSLGPEEEGSLLGEIERLPFREFQFQGFIGKRRTVSFGWRYDFNGGGLSKTEDLPEFLVFIRARAEAFAGIAPGNFQQVLITEYGPGAGIGWHKDRSVFGEVLGISLLSSCAFRLRRKAGSSGSATS